MKVTVLGDTHGRNNWIDIVEDNPGSNFIFLGDYVDPYHHEFIEEDESIMNLYDIIEFKKENPSKVTLLIGNHDAQYLYYPNFTMCGTMSKKYLEELVELFQTNIKLFQMALQKDNYLFIHGGISNGWFEENFRLMKHFGLNEDRSNLAMIINKIAKNPTWRRVLGTTSHYRHGPDNFGSPIWADRMELFKDHLTGFHQVVGHNKIENIKTFGDDETSITFCDCLFAHDKGYNLNI